VTALRIEVRPSVAGWPPADAVRVTLLGATGAPQALGRLTGAVLGADGAARVRLTEGADGRVTVQAAGREPVTLRRGVCRMLWPDDRATVQDDAGARVLRLPAAAVRGWRM
jgi:hypothetical protein